MSKYISQSLSEGVVASKCGRVVSVLYFCDVDSSTNNAKVGTLPEGWRYGEYIAAPAYLGGASGIYVDINSNGEVGYRNNSRSGILYGCITYMVP